MGLWAWWLFRPQPMPFTLRARWKVKDIVTDGIAFSPNGDWLAALVLTSQQGQLTLTVQLWQIPKTQTNPKVFFVSQQVQPIGISSPQLGFSPDGRLLAVGYLEQGVGKVALFTVPEGRRLQTITMGKSKWELTPTVTFAPDGRLAVVHDYRLWFVRIDDGKKTPTNIIRAESIAFSPDGRWMLAAQGQSMNIYDANGHLVRQIQSISPIAWAAAFSKDGQRLACLWWSRQRKLPIALVRRYGVSVWQTDGWRLMRSTPLTQFYEIFPLALPLPLTFQWWHSLNQTQAVGMGRCGDWRVSFVGCWGATFHPLRQPKWWCDGSAMGRLSPSCPALGMMFKVAPSLPMGITLPSRMATSLPFGSARAIELSIGIRSRSAMLSSAFKFAPASFRLHFPRGNKIGFEASQKLGRMRRR